MVCPSLLNIGICRESVVGKVISNVIIYWHNVAHAWIAFFRMQFLFSHFILFSPLIVSPDRITSVKLGLVFSHFLFWTSDARVINSEDLEDYYCRRMAIICHSVQPILTAVDITLDFSYSLICPYHFGISREACLLNNPSAPRDLLLRGAQEHELWVHLFENRRRYLLNLSPLPGLGRDFLKPNDVTSYPILRN